MSTYEAAAVVLSQNEFLTASDSFGSLMTVEVKDLSTFDLKENFEWSDDESVGRVNGLAASRYGKHLAALLEGLGRPYLEVLDREDRTVVYSGLGIVADDTLTWTPNDELVVALDLSFESDPERWGAIGVIPLERLYAATDERIDIDLYATFTRAEWELGVGDVAVSADGSQLVYTRGGDLWVMDFTPGATPHQLTTGPRYDGGAQFSPDAAAIAFVAGDRDFLTETYIIPNHRGEPLFIDHAQGAGDDYLTGVGTLVDSVLRVRLRRLVGARKTFFTGCCSRASACLVDEVGRCLREWRGESDVMSLDETLEIMRTMDDLRRGWRLAYSADEETNALRHA